MCRRSLFLLVKCKQNLVSIWLAVGLMCQVSQAMEKTPMFPNMVKVRSLMALSVRGSLLAMKMS